MPESKAVYVVGGQRTPFAKSGTLYRDTTTQDLMTEALKALVKKYSLEGQLLGDVALGAVMNSAANWNLARECVLSSGLSPYTPAYNVQRACGTSLETVWQLSLKIAAGQMDWAIAGGVDSNSDLPLMTSRALAQKLLRLNAAKTIPEKLMVISSFRPTDLVPLMPAVVEPRTGLSMGQHCEKMVKEWNITQREQDELALLSHRNAAHAYEQGFYEDLIFSYLGQKRDGTVRGDTTLEKLAKLKPAFDRSGKGTLTAGNSSPLTDGAAAVLLANETQAKKRGLPLLARFVDAQAAAVDFVKGDGLLMAPTIAVSELLKRRNLKLQDFDFYEIHEAFSGQVACTLRAWESADYCKRVLDRAEPMGAIERAKMNVKGGSVALGHPFAATGARIVATLAKTLHQNGRGRGLISICTAGGMGVAAILEAP